MKLAPFRFNLLGMLLLTTIVAVMLASVRSELGMAGLLCAFTTGVFGMSMVLYLAMARDCFYAMRYRQWSSLHFYRHWYILFVLLFSGLSCYWAIVLPQSRGGAGGMLSRGTMEAIRIASIIMAGALAVAFVSNKKFWQRRETGTSCDDVQELARRLDEDRHE